MSAATPVDRLRAAAEATLRETCYEVTVLAGTVIQHYESTTAPRQRALAAAVLALLDAAEIGGCGCARCTATVDGIVAAAAAMLPDNGGGR